MLVVTFKLSGNHDTVKFADVQDDAWYASYVNTGVASGVINGMSDGTFGIGKNITRQDVCVMVARALNMDTSVDYELDFEDYRSISEYARNCVGALTDYAVINGFSDNTFKPGNTCTRAQAAKIISNAITAFNSIR